MAEKRMYQNVVFELTDGRLICASVPAFCHVGDQVSVKAIRVTNPVELPEGCSFENLERDSEGNSFKDE